jgi:hypothetical protein
MFEQKDYILRMVKQLAAALARVLGLKQQGRLEEAQQAIDEAWSELLSLPPQLLGRLDAVTLKSMLKHPDAYRAAADLLEAEATIAESRGDPLTAESRRAVAAALREG